MKKLIELEMMKQSLHKKLMQIEKQINEIKGDNNNVKECKITRVS
jgi:hypothetical protein